MNEISPTWAFSEADLVKILRKQWLLTYHSGGVLRGLMCIHIRGKDELDDQLRKLGLEFDYRCYTPHWAHKSQRLIELDSYLQQLSAAAAQRSGVEETIVRLELAPRLVSDFNQLSQQIRDDLIVAQSLGEIQIPAVIQSASAFATVSLLPRKMHNSHR